MSFIKFFFFSFYSNWIVIDRICILENIIVFIRYEDEIIIESICKFLVG